MIKIAVPLCICAALVACSHSVSEAEVSAELKRFLGESFTGEFRIEKSEYSFAIGDDVTTVEADFTEAGIQALESRLRKEVITKTATSIQLIKTIKAGSGFDYLLLDYTPGEPDVHIQYGHE